MYTLHSMPDTAGLAVHLALLEFGQPFGLTFIDRHNGARDEADYRALQPLGLVPALETPDGPIFETAAILLWLADRHGGVEPGPEAPDRVAFLKWLFFTSSHIHAPLIMLFFPDRHTGDPAANTTFQRTVAARIAGHLAHLEAMAATEPDWCSPQTPSVLGYYLAVMIRWIGSFEAGHPGRIDLGRYPALMRLATGLETRPAAQRAAAAEGLGPLPFTAP